MLHIPGIILTSEIIGKEIIGETSKSIFGLLSGINEFNIPYINKILEDLDILKTTELVESLFHERTLNERLLCLSQSQILALNNLHDINTKIKNELELIKEGVEASKEYWFKYFRSAPYHENIDNLKRYKKILDSRLDICLKLTSS